MKMSEKEYEDLIAKRRDWDKSNPEIVMDTKPEQQLDLDVSQRLDQPRVIYHIKPVPKPRQTQSDRWKKRLCVVRYHEFKDQIKAMGVAVPETGCRIIFVLPMPKSWGKKKKDQMRGMPHKQTPDTDNLVKAVLDAVLTQDSMIYHVEGLKFWGDSGQIIIERTSKALRLGESGIIWGEVA